MITYSIIQKSQLEERNRIDSQYFQPEYLNYENLLNKSRSVKTWGELEGKFITGPFGSEFDTANYIPNGKYRYVRGKDVRPFILLDDDNVYIPENDFSNLSKYSLSPGDILISVVGTLGYTAVVNEKNLPAVFSCKSTVFHSKELDPFYLISYLNCKYGYALLIRNERGANQTGLNIEDLKNLPIYIPSVRNQKNISSLVKNSTQLLEDSSSSYEQAEELLLEELGLKNSVFEDELSYVVNLSDGKDTDRIDAEYFQPKYQEIIEKIEKYNGGFDLVKNQFKQNRSLSKKDKEYFNYIEISDVSVSNGEIIPNKIAREEIPANGKITLYENDLLISKVRPYRGAVSFIDFKVEDLLGSGAFTVLQEKTSYKKEVLMIFLKLDFVKDLLLRYNCGTSYPVIKDEDILVLKIPLIKADIQKQIVELVRKSHEARKKTKELLEEAKRKVEEMIER